MKGITRKESPAWWAALIPLSILVASLFFVVRFFGSDSLDGGSQVALLFAAAVTVALSMFLYGMPWEAFEDAIVQNTKAIASAIIVLLLIGAIAGSWMVSGIVPTMIYYGLKVITPGVFLFATCVICALVSVMTGSSWTTIATIGVALVGIGTALGYSTGWTAGAIISGAYFGDKISPLSDTTVLASSSADTPLFTHIRYMMITTVPSMAIACLVFLVVSLLHGASETSQAAEFSAALKSSYNITPWVLLVPVLTGVMIARKLPALLTLFASALLAGITALFAQPDIISGIGGDGVMSFKSGFRGLMITFYGSTATETGNEALNNLVSTNGMSGMLSTIFLILCASTFGASLNASGMIRSFTLMLTRKIKGRTGLVSSTVTSGFFANMLTGDQYLSIILTCSLFKSLYKDKGFESRLLSRSVEDSTTVTSVLIPWNSCGMTQATVLKVATLDYLPYCIFNILSPFMSILIAATGYKIFRNEKETDNIRS